MKTSSHAVAGLVAACLALAACGGEDDDTDTAPEDAAAASAGEDEPFAAAPEPAAPGGEVAAAAIGIDDVVGVWGNADLCAAEPLTIGPDFVSVADEACIVTGLDSTEAGLAIELLCPVDDAEPRPETWTVTTLGEANPAEGIAILRGGETAELMRCASE